VTALADDVQGHAEFEGEDSRDLVSLRHQPRGALSRPPSMIQVSAGLDQAHGPALEDTRSDASAAVGSAPVIFALVAVPLIVAAFCLLCAAPRDTMPPLKPEVASFRSKSHSSLGREPVLSPEEPQLATLGLPPYQSVTPHPFVRCDSSSSTASYRPGLAPGHMSCDVGMLCPALVVPHPAGVTLNLTGDLDAFQQEVVLNVAKVDVTTELLLRLLISETGRDSGILVESVLKLPIAILETGAAVAPRGERRPPPEQRMVVIRRDMDPTRAPYAVVRAQAPTCFVVTRGTLDGGPGEPLLSVLQDTRNSRSNVVAADGKLLASVEVRGVSPTQGAQRIIIVAQHADAALILCAVIASVKLC